MPYICKDAKKDMKFFFENKSEEPTEEIKTVWGRILNHILHDNLVTVKCKECFAFYKDMQEKLEKGELK